MLRTGALLLGCTLMPACGACGNEVGVVETPGTVSYELEVAARCSVDCDWPERYRLFTVVDITRLSASYDAQELTREMAECRSPDMISDVCAVAREQREQALERLLGNSTSNFRMYEALFCGRRARYVCDLRNEMSDGRRCRRIVSVDVSSDGPPQVCSAWDDDRV